MERDGNPEGTKTTGYGERHPASEKDVEAAREEADDVETQEHSDTPGPK